MSIELLHVCEACGNDPVAASARISMLEQQVGILQEDVGNAERELRSKRAQISRLKADQDAALKADPYYEDALEVLAYWKGTLAPRTREITSGKRLENSLARLHARYSVEDLKKAVDGYALKPFMIKGKRCAEGPKDDWHADAELIFRSARHVDIGMRIAERAEDLKSVLAPVVREDDADATEAGWALSPLGKAARKMAEFGFYVFPCIEREKRPATPNGLKNASRDLDKIVTAWTARPHMNVAIRTGAESGIFVLDVDGDEGWDSLHRLEDEHEELPSTLSVSTPRGGQHFYFLHPGWDLRNTAGFPASGLDLRGDGGYVLAPPSVGPGGRQYEVDEQCQPVAAPEWLLGLVRSYQSKVDQSLQGRVDWVVFLNNAPTAGERNTRMTKYVGHLFGVGMDAREVMATAALLNAHAKPPLPDKDLGVIVQSIARAEARKT